MPQPVAGMVAGGGGGGIKFVLLVNKQGQTRLAKYTDASMSVEERRALEGEIVRKCLARSEKQVRGHFADSCSELKRLRRSAKNKDVSMTVKDCFARSDNQASIYEARLGRHSTVPCAAVATKLSDLWER